MIKRTSFLLLSLLGFAWLTSCSHGSEAPVGNAAPQAKTVAGVQHYFAPASGSAAYAMQVTHYTDGSAEVSRAAIATSAFHQYVNCAVEAGATVTPSGSGFSAGFSTDGWYVPFDPTQPPLAIGGGQVVIGCGCDNTSGDCKGETTENPSGGASVRCKSIGCSGNCDGEIIFMNVSGGNGAVLQATSLTIL
ncbi:MAG: hypothetical protein AAGN35_12070 [Bacteroidota bacterium]